MNPTDFITKWGPGGPAYALNEEQGAQSHFLDLCELLGVPKPGSGTADEYLFERQSLHLGQARGYADVFYRDHFAWENKAPGKNLDAALRQLLGYTLALANPPLLVVCDRLTIRIHTQFNGHPSETHTVRLDQLDQPDTQNLLRRLWLAPESFRPRTTNRAITEKAAHSFATLAEQLRSRGHHPDAVAHFLTQCLFCFFAEDVGLLPGRMFERLVGNRQLTSDRLTQGLKSLFDTMRDGGLYGPDDIPWFNGGLFKTVAVPKLEILDITELRNAANLNWSAIDVSIFGTLFERGLDPSKRSQLGAHYTDPATIERIIDPVIRRPLLQKWELLAQKIKGLEAKIVRKGDKHYRAAHQLFITWLDELKNFRVLDPACGSGNFLFLALKALKDVEFLSHTQAATMGLDRETDLVTGPHNVLGIELNEYAAELARVTVWIGELQWRLEHGYPFKTNPVLEPLDHIECRDALLQVLPLPPLGEGWDGGLPAQPATPVLPPLPPAGEGGGEGARTVEAPWPRADVVVGNPPFLGDKKMRRELGDTYVDALRATYAGRVPGSADLVCYWFEKSRAAIEAGEIKRAGLVSSNVLPVGGSNRKVLDRVVATTLIYEAWRDLPWVNNGAAVRVALIAFGDAVNLPLLLSGREVQRIGADLMETKNSLSSPAQSGAPRSLIENKSAALQGITKGGLFEVRGSVAREWLCAPNPNGRSNADVVRPWWNGEAVTQRNPDKWIVDYHGLTEMQAALYEGPFKHVLSHVKPERDKNNEPSTRRNYWLFKRSGAEMRSQILSLPRAIVSPETPTHNVFAWIPAAVIADKNLIVIARSDDVTFGVLSARIHRAWIQRFGAPYGDHPTARRYNSSRTFVPFPFPAGLTPADTAHQRTEALDSGALIPADLAAPMREAASAIGQAAQQLDTLRQRWLNPPEWTRRVPEVVPLGLDVSPYPDRIEPKPGLSEVDAKALAKRTLTNLYNQRPAWLAQAHAQLDAAVAAAYGWADYTPELPDDEILRRLLALNLERATP